MTEDQLELEAINWLVETGYPHYFGDCIGHQNLSWQLSCAVKAVKNARRKHDWYTYK